VEITTHRRLDVSEINDVLILCTRNRAHQVRDRLEEYRQLSDLPGAIVVVDSSDTSSTQDAVAHAGLGFTVPINYLRTSPGLPHQRNIGISWVRNKFRRIELIHFLDDDIIPNPGYFSRVRHIFNDIPNAVAVGGFDPELNPNQSKGLLRRITGIGSSKSGVILPSGIAIPAHPRSGIEECDWLVGGMQSVRAGVFDQHQFDASLRMYGEDIDFYLRIAHLGKIICSRDLSITHLNDSSNRDSPREVQLFHNGIRWLLARRYPNKISAFRVLQVALVLAVGELAKYARTNDKHHLAASQGNLEFFCRLIRHQPVVQYVDTAIQS
jgi:GT2 family glycosyltransferase